MSPLRIAMVGVVLSLLVGVTAHAQEVSSEFEAANALAYKGDYKAAVVAYEAIVSSGMKSSPVTSGEPVPPLGSNKTSSDQVNS